MSYFSAILLMAVNREVKFFSVSMFSSRWAERRIYLPFSSFSRLWISEASISARLLCRTSAMGDPVTYVRSFGRPQSARYRRACSEYAMFTSEIMSTILRLVSSGRHSSLHRFPASMWKMGIWSRLAPMTDKQELVSPRTRTALPNEPVPPMIIRGGMVTC